eukprot:COSAG03_NODE_20686_length_315_cov_0.953704_1_plen_52_part_01
MLKLSAGPLVICAERHWPIPPPRRRSTQEELAGALAVPPVPPRQWSSLTLTA